jgi:hypothetical protein
MKNIFVGQRRLSSLVAAGGLLIFLASQVALGSVTGSISGAVKDPLRRRRTRRRRYGGQH